MGKINRHQLEDQRPSEMLRRMMSARAESVKKHLAPGEHRRKKSTKPLSPARVKRVVAVLNAALNAAVPRKIALNPCEGVILPRVKKVRPLLWTAEREAAFRAALQRKTAAAETDRKLTTVEKQCMWGDTALRPCPVMVWLPAHTGAFLDFIEGERLFALFCLVAYCGLRRREALGLTWAEVDLKQGVAFIRETDGRVACFTEVPAQPGTSCAYWPALSGAPGPAPTKPTRPERHC
jgi:integrase